MRIGLVSKWGEKIKMLKVSDEFVKVVLEKIVILQYFCYSHYF